MEKELIEKIVQPYINEKYLFERFMNGIVDTFVLEPTLNQYGNPIIHTVKHSPHCQNSCHPHPNNPNGGKGDNHGTIQCRTQTSNIKQTFIT